MLTIFLSMIDDPEDQTKFENLDAFFAAVNEFYET